MGQYIRVDRVPPVGVVTLSRPERHNSLVPELLAELVTAVETLGDEADIRTIVLCGDGGSFSTGGDLKAFLAHWDTDIAGYADRVVGGLNDAMLALRSVPVPVVAAAHGWVTGGSLGLLLAADLVLVDETTRLAPFYCEVGFAPDGGWSAVLPGMVGERRAVAAQLANEVWRADTLVKLGLANRSVARGALQESAMAVAREIAAKADTTLRATKANRVACDDWRGPLEVEKRRFVETIQQPGVREGVQAFVDGKG